MPFHRYVTPTYFGGLPGTHDLINVVSGGVGSGDGSAPVNPQKPAPHPNEDTYFVAFGENATSANANRGFAALAENTDFLDDIVHRDQSIPFVSNTVIPGAPVASIALSGDVFVGEAGEIDHPRVRRQLVQVWNSNNEPLTVLVGASYQAVQVVAIHDGGPTVIGSEFYTNPTVDFSPSIPTGIAYRLSYYVRGNVKTQPVHSYARLEHNPLGIDEVSADVRNVLSAEATFLGDKFFNTGTVEFQDQFYVTGTSVFDGTINTNGLVDFNDEIDVNAQAEFYANARFRSTSNFRDTMTFQDDGVIYFLGSSDTRPARMTFSGGVIADLFIEAPFTGPDVSIRKYFGDFLTPNLVAGQFTTLNAARNGATNNWFVDVTSEEAYALEYSTDGWRHIRRTADMDTGIFVTPWTAFQWLSPATADEAAMSTTILGHQITSALSSITDTVKWHTNYGAEAVYKVDIDIGLIDGQYVFLHEPFNQNADSQPRNHRIYASTGGTGPNGSTDDSYCLVRNAEWDRSTGKWFPDASGVAMKYSSETDALAIYTKFNTAAGWADSAWDQILNFDVSAAIFDIHDTFNYGYTADKEFTHVVSQARGVPGHDTSGNSGWEFLGGSSAWRSRVDQTATVGIDQLGFPLNVPSNVNNLTVEVMVNPGSARAGSDRMRVQLLSRDSNWVTPSVGGTVIEDSVFDDGTTNLQVMTVSATLGADLNFGDAAVWIEITPGDDGATNKDVVYDVRVTYDTDKLSPEIRG